ncbi:MAG: FMN-binding protein [Acidimicrobiales bacterium]
MKRSALAVAVTVVGLWLIITFKSAPLPRAAGAAPPAAIAPATSTTTSGTPTTRTPTTATPTTAGASAQRSLDGNTFDNQYGSVQVEVVLDGTRIVDVKPLQMPFDRARSQEISTQAAPLLRQEVLKAQNAQIDGVGGATYTSESYAQSLQSALDKASGQTANGQTSP